MKHFAKLLVLLISLILIEAAVKVFDIPGHVVTSPLSAFEEIAAAPALFLGRTSYTFLNGFIGLGLAGLTSALLVTASFASPVARGTFTAVVDTLQSFPKESLFPIFVIWLGFGPESKILNSYLLSIIPLFVSINSSIQSVRTDYIELYRSFSIHSLGELFQCRIPASVSGIHAALRLAIPLAIVGSVLGEFLGGGNGLGHLIVTSATSFRLDLAFASVYILAVSGVFLLSALDAVFYGVLGRYFDRETTNEPTKGYTQ